MQVQGQRVKISTEGGITIVELTDRKILDEVNISQIGEQIASLILASPQPKLVLDFGTVSHMSSSALGMLITIHKRIREKNGELRLCNIQPAIYEVFVITRLSEIFKIGKSREDAVSSLK